MNVIVERQSPAWGSQAFNSKEASALIASRLLGGTPEEMDLESQTLALHHLWAQCFTLSFASCRLFLKEIAHETWQKVNGCDGIFSEQQHEIVSTSVFGGSGWVLFTDDDDWYSPDIFERIADASEPSTAQCMLWDRVRFNGTVSTTRVIPAEQSLTWAYTNNYAVRANLFASGERVSEVMQHGFANSMVKQRKWELCISPHSGLSLTNKSPCSWNSLNQAAKSQDPANHLLGLVEKYASSSFELGASSRWAAPYVQACQTYFRDVLRTCRYQHARSSA
jgi:hypothetical protein